MKRLDLALLILVASANVSATTIRLIIVGDTNDISIGTGAGGNIGRIRNLFLDISRQADYTLVESTIDGDSFGCDNIDESIKSIPPGEQDVVVFYYAGHGYRRPNDESRFPRFYCGSDAHSLGLLSVTDRLKEKRPRLLISIADTCNVVIAEPRAEAAVTTTGRPFGKPKAAAYKNLFENYRGVLMFSSSTPNQFSWYYPDRGLFTQQFLRSVEMHTRNGREGTWESILQDALVEISVPTGDASMAPVVYVKQNPQADTAGLSKIN